MGREVYFKMGMALIVALFAAIFTTPIVKKIAYKVGAVDVPTDGRRMHKHPIPRLGGLAIFFSFVLAVLIFAKLEHPVQGMLIGAVLIVAVGAIDDVIPLPALLKFGIQIVAALIPVLMGVRVDIVSNPAFFSSSEYLFLGKMSIPITVIWIVAITNSVNLIDGLDGLACGVSTIGLVAMLIIAIIFGEGNVAIIIAALIGACVGFLPYNLNPAKIFMGDTGALFLGYIIANLSVMGLFKMYTIISFAVPFLVVGLPLFDTVMAITRRLIRGENPMKPDREHFHHRLIDMGMNQKQAVAFLYLVSAILGIVAVVITTAGEIKAILFIIAVCIIAAAAYVMIHSSHVRNNQTCDDKDNIDQQNDEEEE